MDDSGRTGRRGAKRRVAERRRDLGAALDERCGAEGWRRPSRRAPRPTGARRRRPVRGTPLLTIGAGAPGVGIDPGAGPARRGVPRRDLDGLVPDVGRRRGAGGRSRGVRRLCSSEAWPASIVVRRVALGAAPCHLVVTSTSSRATSDGLASVARLLYALVALGLAYSGGPRGCDGRGGQRSAMASSAVC